MLNGEEISWRRLIKLAGTSAVWERETVSWDVEEDFLGHAVNFLSCDGRSKVFWAIFGGLGWPWLNVEMKGTVREYEQN